MVYGRSIMEALEADVAALGSWKKQSVAQLNLTGKSGREYSFQLCPFGSTFPEAMKAVYLFAKKHEDYTYSPIYIGQSDRIGACLDNHEKIEMARRYGMTHIGICQLPQGENFILAETDLRAAYPSALG